MRLVGAQVIVLLSLWLNNADGFLSGDIFSSGDPRLLGIFCLDNSTELKKLGTNTSTHESILINATMEVVIEYFMDEYGAPRGKFDHAKSLSEIYQAQFGNCSSPENFLKAVNDLMNAATRLDTIPLIRVDPIYTSSGEKFIESQKLLEENYNKINDSFSVNSDFHSARQILGESLSIMAMFYAHSNWVELGNTDIEEGYGKPGFVFTNLAGAHEATCNGSKLNTTKLTSEYEINPPPTGKCSHGGTIASGDGSKAPGINKGTPNLCYSPHGADHRQAAEFAKKHTQHYLNYLRGAYGNEDFAKLMNLAPVGTSKGTILKYTGLSGKKNITFPVDNFWLNNIEYGDVEIYIRGDYTSASYVNGGSTFHCLHSVCGFRPVNSGNYTLTLNGTLYDVTIYSNCSFSFTSDFRSLEVSPFGSNSPDRIIHPAFYIYPGQPNITSQPTIKTDMIGLREGMLDTIDSIALIDNHGNVLRTYTRDNTEPMDIFLIDILTSGQPALPSQTFMLRLVGKDNQGNYFWRQTGNFTPSSLQVMITRSSFDVSAPTGQNKTLDFIVECYNGDPENITITVTDTQNFLTGYSTKSIGSNKLKVSANFSIPMYNETQVGSESIITCIATLGSDSNYATTSMVVTNPVEEEIEELDHDCCLEKQVGEDMYILFDGHCEKAESYGCTSECCYKKMGDLTEMEYCFKKDNTHGLPVSDCKK